jgi:hypothetical protein
MRGSGAQQQNSKDSADVKRGAKHSSHKTSLLALLKTQSRTKGCAGFRSIAKAVLLPLLSITEFGRELCRTASRDTALQVRLVIERETGEPMKYFATTLALAAIALLLGCGAGHPTIVSVQVNPQSAMATAPGGEVGYTATGVFKNNQSRELTAADGLKWSTSDSTIASIGSNTGQATCNASGTVTVTAQAPADLTFEINNGVHNESTTVTGTATLQCNVTG